MYILKKQFHVQRNLSTLQQDLAAISGQVESTTKEAEKLLEQFPDAAEHITGKHEEMVQAWNVLLEKANSRKLNLTEAENLQMYFDDYRELRQVFFCYARFIGYVATCIHGICDLAPKLNPEWWINIDST